MTDAIRQTASPATPAMTPTPSTPSAAPTPLANAVTMPADATRVAVPARGAVPGQAFSLTGDHHAPRTNFRDLVRLGTGLGDPPHLETAGTGVKQFLPAHSYGAGRILEAWQAVIKPPLTAATNHGRIEQIQERLNELRVDRGQEPLKVDGKIGPQTLWAVHQEMDHNRQRIHDRASVLSAHPEARDQHEIEQLKVELTNAGTLNRAVTALGTDHGAWDATMELLSSMDARMQPQVPGYKPNPY